jgi:hypothetical protein
MAFATFLALLLSCIGSALTLMTSDSVWTREHASLIPYLWGAAATFLACTLASARWFRALFNDQQSAIKTISVEAIGSNSHAGAVGSLGTIERGAFVSIGGVINTAQSVALTEARARPQLHILSYDRAGDGEVLCSGYKELIRLHVEDSVAHDIVIEPLTFGQWVVNFAGPVTFRPGDGRIEVMSIRKEISKDHGESTSKLDEAWRDAIEKKEPFIFPEMTLHTTYRGIDGRKFKAVCSLERDAARRGAPPFRVTNCHDIPD